MTDERGPVAGGGGLFGSATDVDLWQVGASAMHVPSGLFIYGMYQYEEQNAQSAKGVYPQQAVNSNDVWYLKGGIKRAWNPLGSTVLYGEYAEYHDMFGGATGDTCGVGGAFNLVGGGSAAVCGNSATGSAFVTGSEIDRWGLGAVQEIDSAAMHVYARWQHLELDVDLSDGAGGSLNQGFNDWDLFQVGGVIFF
jgi:hypothetical protein